MIFAGLLLLSVAFIVGFNSGSMRTHAKLDGVLWMQTSAEYEASTHQSFNVAKMNINKALNDKTWSAALEQSGNYQDLPPAVIMDVDETVLDNSVYEAQLVKMGLSFDWGTWKPWVLAAKATAIPGARPFVDSLRNAGIGVFYISNRSQTLCDATVINIKKVLDEAVQASEVLCKVGKGAESFDKSKRRAQVAKDYRVLMLLGDDYNDFVSMGHASPEERAQEARAYQSRWGRQWIVIANPVYGNWEKVLYRHDTSLSDEAQLVSKHKHLRTTEAEFLEAMQ